MPVTATPATLEAWISKVAAAEPIRLHLNGLKAPARAAVAAEIARSGADRVWVLTPDALAARRLAEEISLYVEAHDLPHPVHVLPPWTEPPDARTSPDASPAFERLGGLAAAHHGRGVLVVPISAFFQRVLSPEAMARFTVDLETGQTIGWDALLDTLVRLGYQRMERVEAIGEISVRGGVLDLFPPHLAHPVRVELFGDEIESLRHFDVVSQRSAEALERVSIGPCREVLFTADTVAHAALALKERSDALGVPKPERDALVDLIRAELRAPGIEAYLPAFFDDRVPLAAHVGAGEPVLVDRPIEVDQAWKDHVARLRAWDEERGAEPHLFFPAAAFWDADASLEAAIAGHPVVRFDGLDDPTADALVTWGGGDPPVPRDQPGELGFGPVAERFAAWLAAGVSPVVTASSEGQAVRLEELFRGRDLEATRGTLADLPSVVPAPTEARPRIRIVVAALAGGFRWPELNQVLVTDEEIFGPKRHHPPRRRRAGPALDLGALGEGDLVVHRDFGIGVYQGLKSMAPGGLRGDYLNLEYAGGDRLYLPVDRIELVSRYVGGGEGAHVALAKLGGTAWAKTKARVHERVLEMATELSNLAAARRLVKGHAFAPPDTNHHEFAASFPFDETPDQAQAIEDTLEDMVEPRVMDRLVCGDVGYGKTEVAMRAAYLAVLDGKQVAVLVPTTVLSEQHYQSFSARFRDHAVRIAVLSRFRKPAEQKEILEGIKKKTVDIVIGTHRLLGADVRFKDLGLVIIDEEHRFGVAQKDRLRRLRTQVDVISMTATPIPRTLHMSLSGLRDLSVIATPPADRQAIRTFIAKDEGSLIRDAIRRELGRGGQVFFVHNRVQTIEAAADRIAELVPEARIGVGHGQLSASGLEKVMLDFVRGKTDVLVASAIIESGLDIPNANTMLVNRADTFGLAQLYQIRGRIGRGPVQAYCYLLVPDEERLGADAVRRLEALRNMSDLGAGFRLALEDLEIRGAGNLLGKDQSGHVAAVGFDLYQHMVEEAMAELDGRELDLELDPEIHLQVESFLPEDYVPDTGERLLAYRQIARARGEDELDDLRFEWIDRFGKLPQPAQNLFRVMALKCDMRRAGAVLLRQGRANGILTFHERAPIPPARLAAVVAAHRTSLQLHPDLRVTLRPGADGWEPLLDATRAFVHELLADDRVEASA